MWNQSIYYYKSSMYLLIISFSHVPSLYDFSHRLNSSMLSLYLLQSTGSSSLPSEHSGVPVWMINGKNVHLRPFWKVLIVKGGGSKFRMKQPSRLVHKQRSQLWHRNRKKWVSKPFGQLKLRHCNVNGCKEKVWTHFKIRGILPLATIVIYPRPTLLVWSNSQW